MTSEQFDLTDDELEDLTGEARPRSRLTPFGEIAKRAGLEIRSLRRRLEQAQARNEKLELLLKEAYPVLCGKHSTLTYAPTDLVERVREALAAMEEKP